MARLSDVANAGDVLPKFEGFLYGSYHAIDYLFSAPTGSELETWLGTQYNLDTFRSVLAAPEGGPMIAKNADAMAAIANSATAMTEVAGSAKGMQAMVRESAAIDAFVAVSSAMTTLAGSTTAMQAVADSADALNGMTGTQTAAQTLGNSTTAVDAIVADRYAWPIFMANADAASAVASNDTVMSSLISSGDGLDEVFSNASAVSSIGTSGAVFDAIEVDDAAVSKLIAGAAGKDPSRVDSMASLMANIDYMEKVWRTTAATDVLWASSAASEGFWKSNEQGQDAFPVYTDGDKRGFVANEVDSFIMYRMEAYNGGKRLIGELTEDSSSGTQRTITLSWPIDVTNVSTVYVSVRNAINDSYYQNTYLRVGKGSASNDIYVDGNDSGVDQYQERSIDVSNVTGIISLYVESVLEFYSSAGVNGQAVHYFGGIRTEV